MTTLSNLIEQLSSNTTNVELNFKIAVEYERLEQYASAISFYLKVAEFGGDNNEYVYTALLKASQCFAKQDNREHTVINLLMQAISYITYRPEAYFLLSQHYERKQRWQECYTMAILSQEMWSDHEPLPADVGYHGYYVSTFEEAVSSWWLGRKDESKKLLLQLSAMDIAPEYKQAVIANLDRMGVDAKPDIFEMATRVRNIREALAIEVADVEYERFGSDGDGGYVLANDLSSRDFLLSFGVDNNVDFEHALSMHDVKSHLYDYSVDGLPKPIREAAFFKERIGLGKDGDTTISECLDRIPVSAGLILKMDIEGSEFDVINDTPTFSMFRQITMEVHWLNNLEDVEFYRKALTAFKKLRETHYPVLVHPNNDRPLLVMGNSPVPTVFEVLYLRKSSYRFQEKKDPFQGLLSRNLIDLPEMGLSFP